MADVTVQTHVDTFMRSATASAARDALGIQSGATYSTVAEMVAADVTNITSGQTVTLTGYYAAGDFGEPLQLIVEASTGGVKSHTLADGRYANLYADGPVNVKWFGAKGDSTHTPDTENASLASGNPYVGPDGTNDTQAFVDAFAASDHVYVPKSAGWYHIRAGIDSNGADIVIPAGGSLTGDGQIVVYTDYDTMAFSGGVPTYDGGGNLSQAIDIAGDCLIDGITVDGGGQYTPLDATQDEFIYFRVFGPIFTSGTATRRIRMTNCTMYNASGSFLTGAVGNTPTTIVVNGNFFTDYRDHCVYFSSTQGFQFGNNQIRALKSETTRPVVKCRVVVEDYLVNGNLFNVPNGIFAQVSSDATGKVENSMISNNLGVCGTLVDVDGQYAATGAIKDVYIIGNKAVCGSYPIMVGSIGGVGSAANISNLVIQDNYLRADLPVHIFSGTALAKTATAGYQDREITKCSIIGNHLTGLKISGTIPQCDIIGNTHIKEEAGTLDTFLYWWKLDLVEPEASVFNVRGNSFDAASNFNMVYAAGNTYGSVPYTLAIGENTYSGASARITFDTGMQTDFDGTIRFETPDISSKYVLPTWTQQSYEFNRSTAGLYERWITLTDTEVKALNSSPKTLLSAIAGQFFIVEHIGVYIDFNSASYAGANNVEFRIQNSGGAKVSGDLPSATLNTASDVSYICSRPSTDPVPLVNQPIIAYVPTADPTTGDSPLKVRILYRQIEGVI